MNNKEAINILKRGYPDINRYAASESEVYEYDVDTYNEAVEYAISHLEADRWISVSERLPEKTGYYLVTRKGFSIKNHVKRVGYDANTKRWSEGSIIAWRLLPEPYEPKEKENG